MCMCPAKGFAENTYSWIHPTKGEVIERCGGTSKKQVQSDSCHVFDGR